MKFIREVDGPHTGSVRPDKLRMSQQQKIQLQKDYEAVSDFKGDWSKGLREKYNLTHEEILSYIEL